MTAYYNERDPYAAQWLRNLIDAGHIAPGEVDERSITEIAPDDLRAFTQCHFFAGIGVWSHALRRAGWSDDRPVWTGSCPCQPFSAAGKQRGFDDDRHLWPTWFRLIKERRPAIVLGEQVASALDWLDLVSLDMEGAGYAFGAADLCAAGFGGAHIRQRLYFVAHADDEGLEGRGRVPERADQRAAGQGGMADGVADTESDQWGQVNSDAGRGRSRSGAQGLDERSVDGGALRGLADTDRGHRGLGAHAPLLGRDAADWLFCRDGKWRPVGPGTFPLAYATPSRVGRLRAYGNALDAETATAFCAAVREVIATPERNPNA